MKQKTVRIAGGRIALGNDRPMAFIAGNCIIESEKQAFETAAFLKSSASKLKVPFIFKASYDKANRSSIKSFRGPGIERGLEILGKIKKELYIPVLIDVHCKEDVVRVAEIADIIQIPAFLCRQTDLVLACAETGLPVNVKKGQFLAPEDMENIVEKIESTGNLNTILTERGTSFGYHNLVVDFRSVQTMKDAGCPVIFDATHSVQLPGGLGASTGGQREFVLPLAKAAVAVGVAGVFIEVHKDPSKALSDGANSLSLKDVPSFLKTLTKIDRL